MSTELRLSHTRVGSNKHGKSAKDISFTDLVKILTCQNNIRKHYLEQANNILHEHTIANQGMA